MGLTYTSMQKKGIKDLAPIEAGDGIYTIALAGNPNTGKSSVFNALTGLHQHTGNWPGKTVVNTSGEFKYKGYTYTLIDLPGTYSLFSSSVEEEVARNFICFQSPHAVIVVADATCLERNLYLLFQVMEMSKNVVLCINLIDEAQKKNIVIDGEGIEKELGIPVVLTSATKGLGISDIKEAVRRVLSSDYIPRQKLPTYSPTIEYLYNEIHNLLEKHRPLKMSRWLTLRLIDGDEQLLSTLSECFQLHSYIGFVEALDTINKNYNRLQFREEITHENYLVAEKIKHKYIREEAPEFNRDEKIDNILTSKRFGIPIMLLLLGMVFWITLEGANIPSQMLGKLLFGFEDILSDWMHNLQAPLWLHGLLVLGLYRTLAWVISVMLPPMAIFFPMFTLLEDLGYLPRVAFNMDHLFKKACAHGKQCLTMCMGFGCNAAGVVGCRIIESPRERLIAILTNNFVPCNGRFPTLIALASMFFVASSNSIVNGILSASIMTLIVVFGISITLFVSFALSKTLLKGIPSTFTLELPPYRKPQIGKTLYTSIIDRTLFVLMRAICVAAPAGAILWLLANIYIGNSSILTYFAEFLDPIGKIIGLDGYILMAFILGLPANEIVFPILLMAYLSNGSLTEFDSIASLKDVLMSQGWTYLTALNTMLFSLLHWPCSTVLWTIKKETNSLKWTLVSFLIPTTIAFTVCFLTTLCYQLIN